MSVQFYKHGIYEPFESEELCRLHPNGESPGRCELRFEAISNDQSAPSRSSVIDTAPGTVVIAKTEIRERRDFPTFDIASYSVAVTAHFVLSRAEGAVTHHITVMQIRLSDKLSYQHSNVLCDKDGIATRAFNARLKELEDQLGAIDFNGQHLPQIVATLRKDIWVFDQPPDTKCDAPFSVQLVYLN